MASGPSRTALGLRHRLIKLGRESFHRIRPENVWNCTCPQCGDWAPTEVGLGLSRPERTEASLDSVLAETEYSFGFLLVGSPRRARVGAGVQRLPVTGIRAACTMLVMAYSGRSSRGSSTALRGGDAGR